MFPPSLKFENKKKPFGIMLEIEKNGRHVVLPNTVCSELPSDIKNSFWDFLKNSVW